MQWVGEFSCKRGLLEKCGAEVVVQTDRGIELGHQLPFCCLDSPTAVSFEQLRRYVQTSGPEFCRPRAGRVLRQATAQDIDEHHRLNEHVKEDIDQCAALVAELGLDMKIITAEHLLGGERIVFYFRSEGRIDFRELVRELAQRYRTRIEMRQVGARDEARLVADWEVCGRECCCKTFLKKLRPVNMKMAKLQKSTLDPSKVSGRCGRLRCCLRYEHEGYVELAARLPRRGTRVTTAYGEATVVDTQVLTQLVLVRADSQNEYAVPLEETTPSALVKPEDRPRAPEAAAPAAGESEQATSEQTRGESHQRRRPRRGGRASRPHQPVQAAEPSVDGDKTTEAGADAPQPPAVRTPDSPPVPAPAAGPDRPPAAPSAEGQPADARSSKSSRRQRRRRRRKKPKSDAKPGTDKS